MEADRIIAAMEDGTRLDTYFGEITIKVWTIGELCLPTGSVVACDPGYLWSKPVAFEHALSPGRYPVRVSIAERSNGDRRIALAELCVRAARPVRFTMATRPGDEVRSLKPGEIFGHGVDSGTSSFMDLAAAKLLYRRRDRSDYLLFIDYMGTKMERDCSDLRAWADVDVKAKLFERPASGDKRGPRLRRWSEIDRDLKSDRHLIAFRSGFGDGFYASYWGYASDGEIACLVTDFQVLAKGAPESGEDE